MNNVLIIAAHPDDEVLGCGGTIAKLSEAGSQIHVAFMADGVLSRSGEEESQEAELAARRRAGQMACQILGVQSHSFDDFPDNRLDAVPLLEIVKPIEQLIEQHQADTVFTHHAGDVNVDHRMIHQAVVTACRPQQGHPVRTLLFFEVASSTEWQPPNSQPMFSPNWFFDISATFDRKMKALEAYAAEMRDWPHPRSLQGVEHLARWRGATIGADAAEAFILGRKLS